MPKFSVEIVPKDPLWKTSLMAMISEKLGFDGVWMSDHFFNRSVFIALSEAGRRTRRLILGPAVVNPYIHHPATIAQTLATLNDMSGERFRLAVGAGDQLSLSRLGIERRNPVEKVSHFIQQVRNILLKGPMLEMPQLKNLPIFVGAQGRKMLRMGAEIGDGVLVNWSNIEMLKESQKIVREAFPGGREFVMGAHLIISVHEDSVKARKTAIPFAAYLMTGSSRTYLEKIGISEELRNMVARCLETRDWDRLYQISEGDWVSHFSLWGKQSQLEEHIVSIIELGYDEVVLGGPLGPRPYRALRWMSRMIRSLGEDLAPYNK
jgi:5,10-methylenetetrahydromethanopterin reductase